MKAEGNNEMQINESMANDYTDEAGIEYENEMKKSQQM